ncbi:hypothetical protein GCM10022235_78320 [Kribbella ginsengisoli]|uniref:FXSXX-COOH protein n=1 Tax=Kribbella ginsengisoli TaxID=363865 RepID=A0ABP6Z361_9ACTN
MTMSLPTERHNVQIRPSNGNLALTGLEVIAGGVLGSLDRSRDAEAFTPAVSQLIRSSAASGDTGHQARPSW